MPYTQKTMLQIIGRGAEKAKALAHIMEHSPERTSEINSLYASVLQYMPEHLCRFIPLMTDEDLCVLYDLPNPGHATDQIRRAARERTEHIDGLDGYKALELVEMRRIAIQKQESRRKGNTIHYVKPEWDAPRYVAVQ